MDCGLNLENSILRKSNLECAPDTLDNGGIELVFVVEGTVADVVVDIQNDFAKHDWDGYKEEEE